jgi:hypothetical protein
VSAEPAGSTVTVTPVEPVVDEVACPTLIGGAELTARWPVLLGQTVRMVGKVDRALDITNSIIIAEGHRFVVMLRPGAGWAGDAERVYNVMGSDTVATGGPTRLPQLMLVEDPPPCAAP